MIKSVFFLIFTICLFPSLAFGQSYDIQLIPCDCEPENFSTAASQANEGFVYVYNKPDDEVKAFVVHENNEPGFIFKSVTEVPNPDPQVISAINAVLYRVATYSQADSADGYDSLDGIDSALGLAGMEPIQDELFREISRNIQSTIMSDVSFLFSRTRHSSQVSQALGWNNSKGKRITFNDGSYAELKFSEAVLFEGGDVSLEFEILRLVDSEGRTIGEESSHYAGREFSGAESYISGYMELAIRMGFSVDVSCNPTIGKTTISCDSNNQCDVVYNRSSC